MHLAEVVLMKKSFLSNYSSPNNEALIYVGKIWTPYVESKLHDVTLTYRMLIKSN